jgi:hypothetical protein
MSGSFPRKSSLAAFLLVFCFAIPASANLGVGFMIFPVLVLTFVVITGLEWMFLHFLLGLDLARALRLSVVLNLITTLIGWTAATVTQKSWDLDPWLFGGAYLITVGIELVCLVLYFRTIRVAEGRRPAFTRNWMIMTVVVMNIASYLALAVTSAQIPWEKSLFATSAEALRENEDAIQKTREAKEKLYEHRRTQNLVE